MEIKLLDKGEWSGEEVEESIRGILSSNQLLSMATADEKPHINSAFYAFDKDLNLYILTPPETLHGQNLEEYPEVAVDIHDSHQEFADEKQGLQIFGKAEPIEDKECEKALELYSDRYPETKEFAENPEDVKQLDSSFYKIKTERIKVFDEPCFGEETWINVKLERPNE